MSRPSISAVAATLLAVSLTAAAPAQQFDESQVKAAFLYNFMKFVEWQVPRNGSASLVICTTGRGDVNDALEAFVSTRRENGRPVAVRQLASDDDPLACHSVFLAASEPQRSADILARVRNADVLTVGETAQFLAEGGLVRFYVSDNRVRFQIDAVGARVVGLRISPQLLSLAK